MSEKTKQSKISRKKYAEEEKEEENIKDELEDEVGSIDEFHGSNDNRSIFTSYIFTSVHLTENRPIAPSLCTKSDYQEAISNYNDINSSRGFINIPPGMNNREFEIRIDKDMNFMQYISGNKNMNANNQGNNSYWNLQMHNSIKKIKEKINDKEALIKKNNDNINNMRQKISKIEEESKQYERWIENEDEENDRLMFLLNYLMQNKK